MQAHEILRRKRCGRASAIIDRFQPEAQLRGDPARDGKLLTQQLHIARQKLLGFGGCDGMRNKGAVAAPCGTKRNGKIEAKRLWT